MREREHPPGYADWCTNWELFGAFCMGLFMLVFVGLSIFAAVVE